MNKINRYLFETIFLMKMKAFHCLFFIFLGVEMIIKFNPNIKKLIEFTC